MEDDESNVFHKAILRDGSILTIGAEKALLSRWSFARGKWNVERLWEGQWSGQFNRLRDIEVGDVDGDGKDEYVIATHDWGVVAVYNPPVGRHEAEVLQLDPRPNTFTHEIEIGDIDGDGRLEFFATPSERNRGNASQPGEIVMYRWDGVTYRRTVVDTFTDTHAKEMLVADVDRDGKDDLFVVVEGKFRDGRLLAPVEIRRYVPRADGHFSHSVVATIEDRQTRFLVAGDFDGDGWPELVAAAMKTGLYLLRPPRDGSRPTSWVVAHFEKNSSGYEHAAVVADLDGDNRPELYVAADDQGELDQYVWNAASSTFDKSRLGPLDKEAFTWNIAAGQM